MTREQELKLKKVIDGWDITFALTDYCDLVKVIDGMLAEVIGEDEAHKSLESDEQERIKNILNELKTEQRTRAGLSTKGGENAK